MMITPSCRNERWGKLSHPLAQNLPMLYACPNDNRMIALSKKSSKEI
jgi:hypothetical protein